MIWHITKRELLENLISLRFSICFVLAVILISFTTWVNVEDYNRRWKEYEVNRAQAREEMEKITTYSALHAFLDKPPTLLSVFSRGFETRLGTRIEVSLYETPLKATGREMDNPYLKIFSGLDVVEVVVLVFGLIAFFFTFDAINGEKKRGTLKSILSNNIARWRILLGKFSGTMLSLAVPLFVCFLLAIIMILILAQRSLTLSEYARISLIYLALVNYVGFIISLGILISILIKEPKLSLVVCLVCWLFLAIVLPNVMAKITVEFYPNTPYLIHAAGDNADHQFFMWQIRNHFDFAEKNRGKVRQDIFWNEQQYGYKFMFVNEQEFKIFREFFKNEHHEAVKKDQGEYNYWKPYYDDLDREAQLVQQVCSWLPASGIIQFCESLATSSLVNHRKFLQSGRDYKDVLWLYLNGKNALNSLCWFCDDPPGFDLTQYPFSNKEEYQALFRDHENDIERRMDKSDISQYQYKNLNLAMSIHNGLIELMMVIFWNIICFALSFNKFMRYDVR